MYRLCSWKHFSVDEDSLESYFETEQVLQFELEHDKQIIDSNIVEASFDNVQSSKVCSTLCSLGLDLTVHNVNSWVFNPHHKTCFCLMILHDFQCRHYYGSKAVSQEDTNRTSAFIKTSEVALRLDCTGYNCFHSAVNLALQCSMQLQSGFFWWEDSLQAIIKMSLSTLKILCLDLVPMIQPPF